MIPTNRYECEPRKRAAFLEAWDLIQYYGVDRSNWNRPDVDRAEADEIWSFAEKDISGRPSGKVFIADYVPARRRAR